MHRGHLVRTKLIPPRLSRRILGRPRLTERLHEALDYRLTIVQAGAGYGKSTALALLAQTLPTAWYHLEEEDVDPLIFLLHLTHSLRHLHPDLFESALSLLDSWERGDATLGWTSVVDALLNDLVRAPSDPFLLILDDAHHLKQSATPLSILDRLIDRAPPGLHTILSTRSPLKLPSLVTWRARGQVLDIGQAELAFTPAEITTLFEERYGVHLDPTSVARLVEQTEGWAIALQLVWQRLRGGADVSAAWRPSVSTDDLFAYLAQEIFDQQPADIQAFLLDTSVLREMTPAICNGVRNAENSAVYLHHLLESGLFLSDEGAGHYRYHNLFREFLRRRLTVAGRRERHRRAARCYLEGGRREEALYHFLTAGAFPEAAEVLEELGRKMVRVGRLDTLSTWLQTLPPEILESHPTLLVYLGDIARLHSRFDEALGWYRQAEARCRARDDQVGLGQALRGQARVYLDTVNPSEAEALLQEALRLSDGQQDREARARLLELMAENRLNSGDPEEAERLHAQAEALRSEGPGEAELAVRVLLRTGQFDQARRLLEERAEIEAEAPVQRPRAHRETLLLLSLILAFQGEGEAAYAYALAGIERGQALASPFITAVGYMRQGHAWLLCDDPARYEAACRCYREAIRISETLAVPRLRVEAYWGLCRAHGFQGALRAAQDAAERGLTIARQAGDHWIGALILVSLGASYALAEQYEEAEGWLTQAWTTFRESGDHFGPVVTRLWQCWVWQRTGAESRLKQGIASLFPPLRRYGYTYLFTRRTLLGPPDPRSLVPLLIYARNTEQRPHAESLLRRLGLEDITLHPGYQLRIQALGPFRLWRGDEEVEAGDWRRENARQIFLLFLTYRGQLLERERIVTLLWPRLDAETALRDFKVALSRLYKVLEPDRARGAPSAYVARDGTRYGLRPEADIWLDVARFEQQVEAGDRRFDQAPAMAAEYYREALALYHGDYLQEYLYEDWCSEERERLLTLYLRAAERLGGILAQQEAWEDVVEIGQAILLRDNCWEQAYRLLMRAYVALGNRAQALRLYRRCEATLHEELDIAPSPTTRRLYRDLFEHPLA
ncbi:MAG: BTAD domain-containing putative transcriptional regulator [Anaerolineae bacterium]